ncbi:MFS general substrate transporter [Aureobasidium sp. EXF-10727]|nr:MFS general substrate transporter [Aureobasidium sp. EXF-10727]
MAEALTLPLSVEDDKACKSSLGNSQNDSLESIERIREIDPDIERRVVRKCDWWVVPAPTIIFMLSFVDRVNIANARIEGMLTDLHMVKHDYNIALFIVFIPFILCETPSNMILKRITPRVWLSFLLFGCGLMAICQGVTKSFAGLVVCRFILGVFEAGISPGSILLITMYYRREELPRRISWWYMSGTIAGAFGGLLAYALANMSGVRGYGGWRWQVDHPLTISKSSNKLRRIFIIEGCVTVVMSIIMYWWLPNWPADCRFLTPDEHKVLMWRLTDDSEGEAKMDRVNWSRCARDWKVWVATAMYFGIVALNYSTNNFNPTLLKELGYTSAAAQIHSIPLYVVASAFCLGSCYLSTYINNRFYPLQFGVLLGSVGFIILLVQKSPVVGPGVAYMALFFITSAGYIVQPMVVSWVMNNASGHYKRAFTSGTMIGLGNAGGLVSSNVFFQEEAPYYPTGYGTSLALLILTSIAAVVFYLGLKRENARRDAGKRDDRLQLSDADNLGDDHPSFRFSF